MKRAFLATVCLGLSAYLVSPLPGASKPLGERIQEKRSQVEKVKRREGVLTTTITSYNNRISGLEGQIKAAQGRLSRVQSSLDQKRAELLRVRNRLEVVRDQLERARRELSTGKKVLAARLIEIYKADQPDALTVVLEADGFGDLLERTEFLDRISDQDRGTVERVRRLRDRVQRQANELASLERRTEEVAMTILRERDQIAATRNQLVGSQAELRGTRNDRRAVLERVRNTRVDDEKELASLEREQERVQATLAGAASPSAGPIKRGSGQLIWPVNGTITSPFGPRWGRLHAGLDISGGEGTPIRAAASGRVVIAAPTGGYGNYTCVQHGGNLSTCYAHQSRLGTSSGASVRQGQVIGYVGNTGNSFGAHLHFETRVGGSPVDPLGFL